jgi:hypothetical protein
MSGMHVGNGAPLELTEEERMFIAGVFLERVVEKLQRMHARHGIVSCEFAGERYKQWTLRFAPRGDDFEIVDFEYDEDAEGIDLDL